MRRYIDADKHLQKLSERRDTAIIWELNCNDEATKNRAKEAILIFNECILELIDAPTADVRENVRGEWLPDCEYDGEDEWCFNQCSLCDYQSDEQYNFCPNCGADMRGEIK